MWIEITETHAGQDIPLCEVEERNMKKKNNVQLKGQLRMYMQWPAIMTLLLLAMNLWIYMIDRRAGFFDVCFYCHLCSNRRSVVFLQ